LEKFQNGKISLFFALSVNVLLLLVQRISEIFCPPVSYLSLIIGLRVGYGVFPLHLIEFLWRMKQPYNVSVVAELAACAALSNPDYLEVFSKNRI
jgi:hypothetical protein